MQYDVTIGIPVYQSVDYIRRSIESVLAQTYSSIELLIVDDAGRDGSVEMIESIKKIHPRGVDIHIIKHNVNLGVAASRNDIIDNAQGDYLFFMDSDDVIVPNTIELLLQNIRQYDAEIAFGSYEKIETNGKKTFYKYPSIQLLKKDELASFAYRKYAGIQASACNYLLKVSILRDNNHRFINASYWEDMAFTFDLVTLLSKAVLLPDITYSYICRDNSLSNYQNRELIHKDEIMRNVHVVEHLKRTSSLLVNKEYYPNRCLNIVLTDFFIVCNILKRKNDVSPSISNREIKAIMKHPASFTQICNFSNARLKNLFFYFLSILPSIMSVFLIRIIGKAKNVI